jgi:hypothetical protein
MVGDATQGHGDDKPHAKHLTAAAQERTDRVGGWLRVLKHVVVWQWIPRGLLGPYLQVWVWCHLCYSSCQLAVSMPAA